MPRISLRLEKALSTQTARALFAEERRRTFLVYRMNANRGIFVRLATATRAVLKAYLRENISRYIQ